MFDVRVSFTVTFTKQKEKNYIHYFRYNGRVILFILLHAIHIIEITYAWSYVLQEVTKTHFRVCIKDYAGYDGQRSSVAVDYMVIGGNCKKTRSNFCLALKKIKKRKLPTQMHSY